MILTVKESRVYRASDNTPFDTREEALAHERVLVRMKNLLSLDLTSKAGVDAQGESIMETPEGYYPVVAVSDIPLLIARNGDAILAALTVKQGRGPKAGTKKPAK